MPFIYINKAEIDIPIYTGFFIITDSDINISGTNIFFMLNDLSNKIIKIRNSNHAIS
ncbi:protein of unknown function [Tepidibacter aestuarii]|nr:protein of unknown function [Tepidibacter aestuarii]